MKVLFISSHKDTLNSIRPEAEQFIGLARRGVDCTVMTEGDSVYVAPMRDAGIRLIDYAPARKLQRSAIRRIRAELIAGDYDVVYSFNNKAIANANFAARGLPVKVVTYRGQTGNVNRWDPTAYLTHLHPRVDAIICVANAVRDHLRTQHRHPERVVTVYKGHDADWYNETPADLGEFGIPANAFTVSCVANNRPRKGLPVLVAAGASLPPDAPVHFLLVGSGLDDPALKKQIAASPMGDRIHIAGFRSDATRLVAASQVFVLPSLRREGLPKVVIEAMCNRVPVIVTRTGGNVELIDERISGLAVDPGDAGQIAAAIGELVSDPTRRAAMGVAARERIRTHFPVHHAVQATWQVFASLLDDKPLPAGP